MKISFLKNYKALIVASRFEGLPFLVLEALCAGLYVVLPDVPGCKELSKYDGVITYQFNQKDIASELVQLEILGSRSESSNKELQNIYSYEDFILFWKSLE